MPGWPRLLLIVLAFAISSFNGLETGEGALDFIGGIMVLAALFWPGATYIIQAPDSQYWMKSRLVWPSARAIVRHIRDDYGHPPRWSPEDGLNGLVTRHWSFPFPASWVGARDYSGEFADLGVPPVEATAAGLTR